MEIQLIRGCINDYLGINGKKEVNMTYEERLKYYYEIVDKIPELDSYWFNRFLQWVCEEFGEYECSDKPCEQCGDYTETYTLNLDDLQV